MPDYVAHIYYTGNGRHLDFLLILDSRQPMRPVEDVKIVEVGDEHLEIVTRALAEVGYKPHPGAIGILRQSDGLGYLPVVLASEPTEQTAYVSIDTSGTLGRVKVGDCTRALPFDLPRWTGQPTMRNNDSVEIYAAVDKELAALGYRRTSPFSTSPTELRCQVEPGDWTDSPTLVRMDDATSELLGRASRDLGLPADDLAVHYIRAGVRQALASHEWFMAPGLIDHTRITGWLPEGQPITGRAGESRRYDTRDAR